MSLIITAEEGNHYIDKNGITIFPLYILCNGFIIGEELFTSFQQRAICKNDMIVKWGKKVKEGKEEFMSKHNEL